MLICRSTHLLTAIGLGVSKDGTPVGSSRPPVGRAPVGEVPDTSVLVGNGGSSVELGSPLLAGSVGETIVGIVSVGAPVWAGSEPRIVLVGKSDTGKPVDWDGSDPTVTGGWSDGKPVC